MIEREDCMIDYYSTSLGVFVQTQPVVTCSVCMIKATPADPVILAGTGICIMCDDEDEKTLKESSPAYMPHPALPSRQTVLCTSHTCQ